MTRIFLALIVAAALAGPAVAQIAAPVGPGSMTRLDTAEQGRGWEGVGRLDLAGKAFCTGALISEVLVLTAAHCLFDKETGDRFAHEDVRFLAGLRNGRASAYRDVRRVVVHPDYRYATDVSADRVRHDMALLELVRPIRTGRVVPFDVGEAPGEGDRIGIVSYAHDRAEAPALQAMCDILGHQDGVLVTDCNVDFGSSGAPIFHFGPAGPRIVSVVSAKADLDGQRVALGTDVKTPLARLRHELATGGGHDLDPAPLSSRVRVGAGRATSGAKFVRPGG